MIGNRKRLGDLLVDCGKLSQEKLIEELEKQRLNGKRLGEILIEDNIVTEADIINILQVQLGLKRIKPDHVEIDPEAVRSISESLARKYVLMPISFHNDKIYVAMTDPLNIFALDDVRLFSGHEVVPLIATKDEIMRAIEKNYSSQHVENVVKEMAKEDSVQRQKETKEKEISDNEVKSAPVVKLVDSIIDNAAKARASDIHIEPFENFIKVRYRIDGELQEVLRVKKDIVGALTTRIKILAGMNIAERRVPQDGRILTKVNGKDIDLRVSDLPTIHGEKIVIRILKRDGFLMGKDKLGMCQDDIEKLNRIMNSPYGIILVTGPTGSGKSTTLYTVLSELNKTDTNIITVEDPVEYMMEGINQVNVNTKAGLTFASGLRSILRQDPDIIMIGEIRDNETAEIAVRSAITGHLVLSTVHTNDAPSTIVRLVDMDIEPFLIATSLSGIIAQRLVRRVCPNCAKEYEASAYEKKILGVSTETPLKLKKGTGCSYCNNTGYRGRVGVHEVLEITKEIRDLIMSRASSDELREACIKVGMNTLSVSCARAVIDGVTSMEELAKITFLKAE